MKKFAWTLLETIVDLFHLLDDEVALNVCKVMTVMFIAGFMFSAALLDSDQWIRPLFSTAICTLGGSFFAMMTAILEGGLE